jgi:hypothetical protein
MFMKAKGFAVLTALMLFVVVSAAILTSCSKSKTEGKLVGKWKVINIANLSDTINWETWEFTGDNRVIYGTLRHFNGFDSAVYVRGQFSMYSYKKVDVVGFGKGYEHVNGSWEITKLDESNLMMVNDIGGLYFREMSKVN